MALRQLGEIADVALHVLEHLGDLPQQVLEIDAHVAEAASAASPKDSRRLS